MAMAIVLITKAANEMTILMCQSRKAVSLSTRWRGLPGLGWVLTISMIILCEARNIYWHFSIYFLLFCKTFKVLFLIPEIETQQSIMAESLVYKPRMDLSNNLLFRLSLYYMYVSSEFISALLKNMLNPEAYFGSMYSANVFQSSLYPFLGQARLTLKSQ